MANEIQLWNAIVEIDLNIAAQEEAKLTRGSEMANANSVVINREMKKVPFLCNPRR
jgi:hypothetical protein